MVSRIQADRPAEFKVSLITIASIVSVIAPAEARYIPSVSVLPSTPMIWPLMLRAFGDARKAAMSATSDGSIHCPSEVWQVYSALISSAGF
jgi:hypothetical protein